MKEKIKMKEKLAYALGDVGCNFVWTTVSMFLTLYYTNNVGIAAGVVGTIMLFTRLFDGVTDLIFGSILDRTHTKMGKARPWILRSVPMMAIGLILVFNVPGGLSDNGKIIYAVITYVFVAAIAFTISNLAYNALMSLMTDDPEERASVSSVRFMAVFIVGVVLASGTMPLVNSLGWTVTSIIYAAVATACLLITVFGTKERAVYQNEAGEGEKMPVKEGFRYLFKNRYFYSIMLLFVAAYAKTGISSGIGIYFMKYVLGNENLLALFSIVSTIPMLIGFPMFPMFVRKFGKWKCLMAGVLVTIVSFLLIMLNPHNIPFVLACTVISSFGSIPLSAGLFALVGDGVVYGEWKNGVRQDGLFNSVVSFGMKVGTGLGTAMIGWGLELGRFDGTAAVQAPETIRAITFVAYGVPAICMVFALIFLMFSNIDKIYPQMEKDLAERRAKA